MLKRSVGAGHERQKKYAEKSPLIICILVTIITSWAVIISPVINLIFPKMTSLYTIYDMLYTICYVL